MIQFPDSNFHISSDPLNPKVNGVMVGIVTNNNDPEGLARVKLKLPLREVESETDWVRMTTLMGGKDMGSLFIPEVGDEVLVAFHLGELRLPFVIGVLWSKKQPAPKGNDKNDIRKIKSRAGHEIIFDDADGKGNLTIKTTKGQIVKFSDEHDSIKIAEQSGGNEIMIQGGTANSISIKSGSSTITMNNKGDIAIESSKEIKIKSTQISIEATATMALKAGATLDLKSDGIINIKGSLVKIN